MTGQTSVEPSPADVTPSGAEQALQAGAAAVQAGAAAVLNQTADEIVAAANDPDGGSRRVRLLTLAAVLSVFALVARYARANTG